MTPPVIGLTTYREVAGWGVWQQAADILHTQYADTVVAAGGVAVLLPPATDRAEVAAATVSRLDGLVVTGGADVEPARYGADSHERTAGWRTDRDAWELALLNAADEVALPVLGICRGMQVMAVRAGGLLHQHVPDLVGDERHSPGGAEFGHTAVHTEPGSRCADLIGERVVVACHHHQSVATAPGFEVTATSPDGIVEAIETPGDRFCLAVQWHPEMRTELQLMTGLLAAARTHRALADPS